MSLGKIKVYNPKSGLLFILPMLKTLLNQTKMVFRFKNCSDLMMRKTFVNSRLKAKNLQKNEITSTIYPNSER